MGDLALVICFCCDRDGRLVSQKCGSQSCSAEVSSSEERKVKSGEVRQPEVQKSKVQKYINSAEEWKFGWLGDKDNVKNFRTLSAVLLPCKLKGNLS